MLFNSVTKQRFYANGIGYGLSVDDKDKARSLRKRSTRTAV
jgi:hypothetical protein